MRSTEAHNVTNVTRMCAAQHNNVLCSVASVMTVCTVVLGMQVEKGLAMRKGRDQTDQCHPACVQNTFALQRTFLTFICDTILAFAFISKPTSNIRCHHSGLHA